MLLQPEDFEVSDLVKPNGKLGLFAEAFLKLRKEGYKIDDALTQASLDADYYASGFGVNRRKKAIKESLPYYLKKMKVVEDPLGKEILYLSAGIKNKFDQCIPVADKAFKSYLHPEGLLAPPESFNEYAILCELEIEEEGEIVLVKLKGKLDNYTIDHMSQEIILNDLKTTGKPVSYFMGGTVMGDWLDGSFQKFHYYRQMALYLWLLKEALSLKDYTVKANMLVVESVPNFGSRVYKVGGKSIQAGFMEFKALLLAYAKLRREKKVL